MICQVFAQAIYTSLTQEKDLAVDLPGLAPQPAAVSDTRRAIVSLLKRQEGTKPILFILTQVGRCVKKPRKS
jgi:hypothetical protein